jgi:hypothetical protein
MRQFTKKKAWGCSTNQEDYHVNFDYESNLDQALEMVLEMGLESKMDLEMGQASEKETIPFWWGRARQYDAAYFINESLTQWDYFEERAQEMFYDETLCENDNVFKFPEGYDRTLWFVWMRNMVKKMCSKFDIEINYFEVTDPQKVDVTVWFVGGEDEPRFEFYVGRQRYGSHPMEKSAPEREPQ